MDDPLAVLSFAEFKAQHVATEEKRGSTRPKCTPAYDPSSEPLPKHAWYDLDRSGKGQEINDIVDMATDVTATARPEDKELISLRKMGNEVRGIDIVAHSEVAIVGQQGMGKSLLINALTNRRHFSKTSARGGACTASAIKYRHKSGASDTEETYDALVQFMDEESLKEVIAEHGRRYHHFVFGEADPDYYYEEQRASQTAEEFLHLLFNTKYDPKAKKILKGLLTPEGIMGGKYLSACLDMARTRIEETYPDKNGVLTFEGMHHESLMAEVEQYIADFKDLPTLWPIVDNVTILMGSSLARNGVCLVDLPGLGDLNQSRTAATNAIRRKAGFEIIVAKSERVTTEEVVDQQIQQSIKAHGAKNTILVLTKIDEYFLDSNSVETEIESSKSGPFPLIKRYLRKVDKEIEDLEDDNGEDADKQIQLLEAYHVHLMQVAQYAFIHKRARDMEKEMRNKYLSEDPNPIQVFSVSASMYLDWLKVRQKERPFLSPEMTGIPALRKFLLGLSAETNYQEYRNHVFLKLPRFLGKLRRVAHDENKDGAYAVIRPRFQELVANLENHLQASFEEFRKEGISPVWTDSSEKGNRLENIVSIVKEWGDGTRWNTYNKVLREKGMVRKTTAQKYVLPGKNFGSINWNEDISIEILPDMKDWKRMMNLYVSEFAYQVDRATQRICEDIVASITNSSLTQELKNIALKEWSECQERVFAHTKDFDDVLRNAIKLTYQYATTETDIRCMVAKANWGAYDIIEQQNRVMDWYSIQRRLMISMMCEPDDQARTLLDRIDKAVKITTKKNLKAAFAPFLDELIKEVNLFDDHIADRVPVDYDLRDGDAILRRALRGVLPALEQRVGTLQRDFKERMVDRSEKVDERVDAGSNGKTDGSEKDKGKEAIVEDWVGAHVYEHDDDERHVKRLKVEDPDEEEVVKRLCG
ncbi:hypothetical protein P280DRAFT_467149 [Massarina eburnea CBS 473.64]|uniref:Dynamin N-terminal domain-containing protein n=1 Tax=Massarina eburnea CBS 473.64 TaxID=1395130 RepID=A0A6A6S729_9PLEO|nr:hypothetical protein P280DRAFT_467149 [Massarina eburnea CBS 473.64]